MVIFYIQIKIWRATTNKRHKCIFSLLQQTQCIKIRFNVEKNFTRIWLWLEQERIFCIRTSHDLIWWKLLEAMYLAKSNYIITSNIIKYNMLTSNHVPVKLLASCLFLKYRESNLLVYKSNAIFPLGDILK